MTSVVLIDAGRSAVIPDDPDLPETPTGLTADVIAALLRRTGLDRSDVTELFLADPRCLSTGCAVGRAGWRFDLPPLGLPTTVSASGSLSVAQAMRAVEQNPDVVAVVAACDFGVGAARYGGDLALPHQQIRMAHFVAAWWDVAPEETAGWARESYSRSAECSAAGDFAGEIVCTAGDHLVDRFVEPEASDAFNGGTGSAAVERGHIGDGPVLRAHAARGASAIILTSEPKAIELGLEFRARLHTTAVRCDRTDFGIAPLGCAALDELLAPCGITVGGLDQLEVPEQYAVTPLAWIRETGISEYLVNPRGGDLSFGHLPRSGQLRSLVTMVHSLEVTGGLAGALVSCDADRTTALVLTLADSITPKGWKDTAVSPATPATVKKEKT
ncbi:hypothetical protein K7711_33105 [Nocardia sp. CA2R105]|uniref:hypothetical protein n=1 Tax=Nocardia coffeae TaxID=2873381 RepID=UPI001CA6E104|nr:hypothetical protein [Nocardia coffeae]MBY8861355.1 hypothetical protein [Nocardia coffeae]